MVLAALILRFWHGSGEVDADMFPLKSRESIYRVPVTDSDVGEPLNVRSVLGN